MEQASEQRVQFQFEGRYFQIGTLSPKTKKLIFVLHGHGQLAQYFIKKFDDLASDECCIIAPEGLNRYYLNGFTGRVGSTWMTKEDRLTDISNYLTFLNSIYDQLSSQIGANDVSVAILGFSQGAATASRWAATASFEYSSLILWAGLFPPDMDFTHAAKRFKNKSITYVYGTEDIYINDERIKEMEMLSKKLEVSPKVVVFKGPHEIDKEVLSQISF